MSGEIIYVDRDSDIPIFGIDFLGIIDRGTNVLEVKPLTICNLKCKYCFVNAGEYRTNFVVSSRYLLERLNELIELKGRHGIEVHIAPYGESLIHPEVVEFVKGLRGMEGVETVSMQTNGLLLTEGLIRSLEKAGLSRMNVSLNTLNEKLAKDLGQCGHYDLHGLLAMMETILESRIHLLIAPVWFAGINDEGIIQIIEYVKELRERGYSDKELQIGIQKYLTYKTGRKLRKIRPKGWNYFYQQLERLEQEHDIKLKLSPEDFGIHERKKTIGLNLRQGEIIPVTIVSKGRYDNEAIGKITDEVGIKVLLNNPLVFSEKIIGKSVKAKVIRSNLRNNILTAATPY